MNRPQSTPLQAKSRPVPARKAPTPPVSDEIEILDEFEEFESFDDDVPTKPLTPRPSVSSSRPAAPPARRTSRKTKTSDDEGDSGNAAKWVLIGGGVLVGLSLLVAVVYLGIGAFTKVSQMAENRKRSSFDLTYLPKYTQKVMKVRVEELWQSPFVQSLTEDADFTKSIEDFREKFGMGPEDIESLTYATGPPPNMMGHVGSKFATVAKAASGVTGAGEEHVVIVIRAKKPFDVNKISSYIGMSPGRSHEGVDYMMFAAPRIFRSVEMGGGYLPDEKTLVLGTVRGIESVIEQKGAAPDCSEIEVVDSSHQIIMAHLPKNVAFFGDSRELENPAKLEMIKQMNPDMYLRSEFNVIASSFDFSEGLSFLFQGQAISEETAKQTHDQIRSEKDRKFDWSRPAIPVSVGYVRPPATFIGMEGVASKLRNTATHELNGNQFSAKSSLSAEDLDLFQAILTKYVPMALSGNVDKTYDLGVLVQLPSNIYRRKGSLISAPTDNFGQMYAMADFLPPDMPEGEDEAMEEMSPGEETGEERQEEEKEEPSADAEPPAAQKENDGEIAETVNADPVYEPVDPAQVKPVIDALAERGVKVETGTQGDHRLVIDNPDFSDEDLQIVTQLPNVSMIVAFQSNITDHGFTTLAELGETLRVLELFGAQITLQGMAAVPFEKYTALRLLNLSDTQVHDGYISSMEKIPALRILVAQRAHFTEEAKAQVTYRVIR